MFFVWPQQYSVSVNEEEWKQVSSLSCWTGYIPPTESVRLLFLVVKRIRQWISKVFSTVISQMSSRISRDLITNIETDNIRADSHSGMVFFINNMNKNTLIQCQIQKLFNVQPHLILFFFLLDISKNKKPSQYTLTLDTCAALGSADAPWPHQESWEFGEETVNLGFAPGGNTRTGSLPTSLVSPTGQWTTNGSLQGNILKMEVKREVRNATERAELTDLCSQ